MLLASDAVVLGQIADYEVNEEGLLRASLTIEEVLTESSTILQQGDRISVYTTIPVNSRNPHIGPEVTSLYLLKLAPSQQEWQIISGGVGAGGISELGFIVRSPSSSRAASLAFAGDSIEEKYVALVIGEIDKVRPHSADEALFALESFSPATISQALDSYRGNGIELVELVRNTLALLWNEPGALKRTEDTLLQLKRDLSKPQASLIHTYMLGAISMNYRQCTAEDIEILAQLAFDAHDLDVRQSASFALRSLHTVETLPHLRRLLDDSDNTIAYNAVLGLYAYAEGWPVFVRSNHPRIASSVKKPDGRKHYLNEEQEQQSRAISTSEFEQNPQQYLQWWKEWYDTVGVHEVASASLEEAVP
jgi:hypothetical protein